MRTFHVSIFLYDPWANVESFFPSYFLRPFRVRFACFHSFECLKRYAGFEFGVVSSALYFHIRACALGLYSAPTQPNHNLASDPIFGG